MITETTQALDDLTLFEVHFIWDYEQQQSAYLKHSAAVLNQILKVNVLIATRLVMNACANGKTLIFSSFNKEEAIECRDKISAFGLYCNIVPTETEYNKNGNIKPDPNG